MPETWSLHPQLEADTVALGDLALTRVLFNDDAAFPWLILVPRQPGLVDLTDLTEGAQRQMFSELTRCAGALKATTGYDKLNVAALGNMVPQLHVHVIARFRTDAAWPNPVWGHTPRQPYESQQRNALVTALRQELNL